MALSVRIDREDCKSRGSLVRRSVSQGSGGSAEEMAKPTQTDLSGRSSDTSRSGSWMMQQMPSRVQLRQGICNGVRLGDYGSREFVPPLTEDAKGVAPEHINGPVGTLHGPSPNPARRQSRPIGPPSSRRRSLAIDHQKLCPFQLGIPCSAGLLKIALRYWVLVFTLAVMGGL